MSAPPRWLATGSGLPPELARALSSAPGEPSQAQLGELASSLSGLLGMPLPLPLPAPAVVKTGLVTVKGALSTSATVGASAAKPLLVLGAWVLGGVVVGAGLSGVAYSVTASGSPAPVPALRASSEPNVAAAPASHSEPMAQSSTTASATGQPAPAATPRPTTLRPESELALLKRAQRAVATDPARALALSDQHAKLFKVGLLEQEREMIAIDALQRLGRSDEAARRARQFRTRYPGSAHVRRLSALRDGQAP